MSLSSVVEERDVGTFTYDSTIKTLTTSGAVAEGIEYNVELQDGTIGTFVLSGNDVISVSLTVVPDDTTPINYILKHIIEILNEQDNLNTITLMAQQVAIDTQTFSDLLSPVAPIVAELETIALNIDTIVTVGNISIEISEIVSEPLKSAILNISEEPLKQSILDAKDNATNAESAWNDFKGRYYGSFLNDPVLNPNGESPTNGDLYFSTLYNKTRIYNGSLWGDFGSAVNGFASNDEIIATQGQTLFTGLSYDVGFTLVYRNGFKIPTTDYTATDGTTLTFTPGADLDDEFTIVSFGAFSAGVLDNILSNVAINSSDILNAKQDIIDSQTDIGFWQDETSINSSDLITVKSDIVNAKADIIVAKSLADLNAVAVSTKIEKDGTTMQDKSLYVDRSGDSIPHVNGNVYYSNDTLNIMTDHDGVVLQVGQELHVRVFNNTGSTILNGKACRRDGVTGGLSNIALALADSFANATVLGFATHDIPAGEHGLLSVFGNMGDVNTSAFPVGSDLYLSSTSAGDVTDVAPIIRTILGNVMVQDVLDGVVFINVVSNVPLPRTLGSLSDASAPTSLPLDLVDGIPITNWANNVEIVTTADKVSGRIVVPLHGIYRLNVSLHMVFDGVGGAGKKELYLDLIDVLTGNPVKTIKGFILKDAETYDMIDNGAVTLTSGREYQLELRSEIALTGFSFSSSTFYIESILY